MWERVRRPAHHREPIVSDNLVSAVCPKLPTVWESSIVCAWHLPANLRKSDRAEQGELPHGSCRHAAHTNAWLEHCWAYNTVPCPLTWMTVFWIMAIFSGSQSNPKLPAGRHWRRPYFAARVLHCRPCSKACCRPCLRNACRYLGKHTCWQANAAAEGGLELAYVRLYGIRSLRQRKKEMSPN